MHSLVIFVAKYFIVIPVIIALVVLIQLKGKNLKWRFVIEMAIAGVVALLLAKLSSMLWYDPRPFVVGNFTPWISHAMDNGFPSDHTLLASLIGWVVLAYSRKYGVAALIVAFLIGASRVIAGVHHPLDILGSFVISAIAAFAVLRIVKVFMNKREAAKKVAPEANL